MQTRFYTIKGQINKIVQIYLFVETRCLSDLILGMFTSSIIHFELLLFQRWNRLQGSNEKGPGPVAGGLVVEPPAVVSFLTNRNLWRGLRFGLTQSHGEFEQNAVFCVFFK